MTGYRAGISMVIASARPPDVVDPCITAARAALDLLPEPAELVVVRDTARHSIPAQWAQNHGRQPIRVLWTGQKHGSSYARRLGVDAAIYDTILFTDDDTLVPPGWATRMAEETRQHGVVTGTIRSRTSGFWERCDEAIDFYRVNARTDDGTLKFVSFPNLGIIRAMFTSTSLDLSVGNRVDDIELACRLRLVAVRPRLADTVVAATYPSSYRAFLSRKIRHGIGMGRLRAQLGSLTWHQLELGRSRDLLRRWIVLSRKITATAGPVRRIQVTVANLAYCFAFLATATVLRAGRHPSVATTPPIVDPQ